MCVFRVSVAWSGFALFFLGLGCSSHPIWLKLCTQAFIYVANNMQLVSSRLQASNWAGCCAFSNRWSGFRAYCCFSSDCSKCYPLTLQSMFPRHIPYIRIEYSRFGLTEAAHCVKTAGLWGNAHGKPKSLAAWVSRVRLTPNQYGNAQLTTSNVPNASRLHHGASDRRFCHASLNTLKVTSCANMAVLVRDKPNHA